MENLKYENNRKNAERNCRKNHFRKNVKKFWIKFEYNWKMNGYCRKIAEKFNNSLPINSEKKQQSLAGF